MKFASRRTLTNNLGQHGYRIFVGPTNSKRRYRRIRIGRLLLFEEKEIDRGCLLLDRPCLSRSANVATCAPNPSLTPFNRSSTRHDNPRFLALPLPSSRRPRHFLRKHRAARYHAVFAPLNWLNSPRSLLILNATPPLRSSSRHDREKHWKNNETRTRYLEFFVSFPLI